MEITNYPKIVKRHMPKPNKGINALRAFICGGVIGIGSEVMCSFIMVTFGLDKEIALVWTGIMVVLIASLLTAFGVFDDLVSKYICGLIVPTTGFAHALISSMMDYKKEGLITGIGANCFKLAGSVILYGIVSAFAMALLWGLIYG